jgi:uncharacterized protein
MTELQVVAICAFLLVWLVKKLDLGIGLLIGSAILGVLNLPVLKTASVMLATSYRKETVELTLSLLFIYYFMGIWRASGRAGKLVKNLERTVRDPRAVLVLPSALIGLIPLIGGAMISAPLLEDSVHAKGLTPERKTFLNYWFRHIWEYILPTYPGIILSASLLKISFGKIFLLDFPLTVGAILVGIFFGLRGITGASAEHRETGKAPVRELTLSMLPILTVIILVLAFGIKLYIAIAAVIAAMLLLYKIVPAEAWKIFKDTFTPNVISLVIGIMCFRNIMESSGIITRMSADFISWHVPVLLLLFLLPFIIGFLTGITVAYVGIAFPLLLGYLNGNLWYLPWAYFAGYFGELLSPMHYCLTLTKEYFKAEWRAVYKLLVPASAALLLVAFVYIEGVLLLQK